jgi:glycosyltransferase involved in cell wall biosynthesis
VTGTAGSASGALPGRHVVVPYDATNSTVRARALQWIDRVADRSDSAAAPVTVHGPGWPAARVPGGAPVLLLRNVRRLTRGRAERALLADARPGVYDLDDGLPWDDGTLPGLGRWWKRPWPRSLVAERAARAADRVIVGNDVLADWAAGRCRDVRIVPTCIEPTAYRRRTCWDVAGPHPTIGWIGSPATEQYLWDIEDALVEVHRRTGAQLHVISGSGSVPPGLAPFARRTRWDVTTSNDAISAWDVGVMPLRDGVYERAKCGYKLLQYAAAGVPAVGSPVGVNRPLLASMDGLAPVSTAEWVDSLVAVLEEPAGRRARRAACGTSVAAAYSYDAWEGSWLDAVGWAMS